MKNLRFFFSSLQEQRLKAGKTMKGDPEDRPDNIEKCNRWLDYCTFIDLLQYKRRPLDWFVIPFTLYLLSIPTLLGLIQHYLQQ